MSIDPISAGFAGVAAVGAWVQVWQNMNRRQLDRIDEFFDDVREILELEADDLVALINENERVQEVVRRTANAASVAPDPDKRAALAHVAAKALACTDDAALDDLPVLARTIDQLESQDIKVLAALRARDEHIRKLKRKSDALIQRADSIYDNSGRASFTDPDLGVVHFYVTRGEMYISYWQTAYDAVLLPALGPSIDALGGVMTQLESLGLVRNYEKSRSPVDAKYPEALYGYELTNWGETVWGSLFYNERLDGSPPSA